MRALALLALLFTATVPAEAQTANFEAVRVHSKAKDGVQGIEIECRLTIHGQKDKSCDLVLTFFDSAGQLLKDTDGQYFATDGTVASAITFVVGHNDTLVDTLDAPDYRMFVPYSQLHLPPGVHPLRARLTILDGKTKQVLGTSNLATFSYTQP
jgi:hypothetical protein